jgi:hypothetical protein
VVGFKKIKWITTSFTARLIDREEYMDRDWDNMYITDEELDKAASMVDSVRWARAQKEERDLEKLWLLPDRQEKDRNTR